jgi:opacity protein-like surface antigen
MLAAAQPARAQGTGAGFLFGAPSGSFVLRGGFDQALAGSDLFAQTLSDFTLRKRDFAGFDFTAELTASLSPRWDLVFGGGWSGSSHASEYRDWVDNNHLPIRQTTSFQRVPLTAGARYYLVSPGERIGRLAWVPHRVAPFVGGGLGAIWYRFRQYGDFIGLASATKDVFSDDLSISDWALAAYAEAGVDITLTPRIFLTGEGRYTWSRGHVGADYSEFGHMDLSGVAVTVGVGFRM